MLTGSALAELSASPTVNAIALVALSSLISRSVTLLIVGAVFGRLVPGAVKPRNRRQIYV